MSLTDDDDHPGAGDHGGPLSRWMFVPRRCAGSQPPPAPHRTSTAAYDPAGAEPEDPGTRRDPGATRDPGVTRDPGSPADPPGTSGTYPPDEPPPF